MRIAAHYSHLNGLEYLQVHKAELWIEIQDVIATVDAESCKTKISKEKRMKGKALYAPIALNEAMDMAFTRHNWSERRTSYWVTEDAKLIQKTMHLPASPNIS